MEVLHIPVSILCFVFASGVALAYSSASTGELSTEKQYRIQYRCRGLNLTMSNGDCEGFSGNASIILETCQKENYSNSCNVYTNPNDDSITFCLKSEGNLQCINIRCNLTSERGTDSNKEETIYTDTLRTHCLYKYVKIKTKDCVLNVDGEGQYIENHRNAESGSHTNLSGSGWSMLSASFLSGALISSIFFYLRDWIRKRWNIRHSILSKSMQTEEDSNVTNVGYLNGVYTDISNMQEEESDSDHVLVNSNTHGPSVYSDINPVIPDVYNYSRSEEDDQSAAYNVLKGSEDRMKRMERAEHIHNENTSNHTILISEEQSVLTSDQRIDMPPLYFCLEKREDVTLNETP